MTVSRAKSIKWGLAAALLVFSAGAEALAQSGPIKLAPPVSLQPPINQNSGGEKPAESPIKPLEPENMRGVTGIQVDSLNAVNPESAGTLTPETGGFPLTLWQGASRELVERLLPEIPGRLASPTLRDLSRRMMLSMATPPVGDVRKDLLNIRIGRLAAMGDLLSVGQLLQSVPNRVASAALVKAEADAYFLTSDYPKACGIVGEQILESEEIYWRKAFVFCQALAGEHDKAYLGAQLMRDEGADEPVFFSLVDAIASKGSASLETLEGADALTIAMMRSAQAPLPDNSILPNSPSLLRAIAVSPYLPVKTRLRVAERAEASGSLDITALRQIYGAVPFTEEDLEEPLNKADELGGAMGRAILYQAALGRSIPAALVEVLVKANQLAEVDGLMMTTARVFLPILKRIEPDNEMLPFASQAIRMYMMAGDVEAAAAWYRLIRSGAVFEDIYRTAYINLLPLARIADGDNLIDVPTSFLSDWWRLNRGLSDGPEKAHLFFVLANALEGSVTKARWYDLLQGNLQATPRKSPPPPVWYVLSDAAEQGRVGETLVYILVGMGSAAPGEIDPMFLSGVLKAMIAVGLEKEARALALEAALGAGL